MKWNAQARLQDLRDDAEINFASDVLDTGAALLERLADRGYLRPGIFHAEEGELSIEWASRKHGYVTAINICGENEYTLFHLPERGSQGLFEEFTDVDRLLARLHHINPRLRTNE